MTFYDLILELEDDKEELTRILIELDSWLERLHKNGFCIYDFDLKKIILENGKLTFGSFRHVLNNIKDYDNAPRINILQENKIGLLAYNDMPIDGNMNQQHFEFLQANLEFFNKKGQIPEEIYEYYEEVFRRLNIGYLNDYLIQKQEEKLGNQNTNSFKKSLATDIGRAYSQEDNAFINILFIPSIITFCYLIGLFIYIFIIR